MSATRSRAVCSNQSLQIRSSLGSGWQGSKKATVEGSLVLTASALVRKKALVHGAQTAGSWGWTHEGEDGAHATIRYEADLRDTDNAWLRLHYQANGEAVPSGTEADHRAAWPRIHRGDGRVRQASGHRAWLPGADIAEPGEDPFARAICSERQAGQYLKRECRGLSQ